MAESKVIQVWPTSDKNDPRVYDRQGVLSQGTQTENSTPAKDASAQFDVVDFSAGFVGGKLEGFYKN